MKIDKGKCSTLLVIIVKALLSPRGGGLFYFSVLKGALKRGAYKKGGLSIIQGKNCYKHASYIFCYKKVVQMLWKTLLEASKVS